jgi:hypothetical protein
MYLHSLPLIDLSQTSDIAVLHDLHRSLRQFGAFRITAPVTIQLLSEDVFQKVHLYINLPNSIIIPIISL